jgi:hypothetical protein
VPEPSKCKALVDRDGKEVVCGHERAYNSRFCTVHTTEQGFLKKLKERYTEKSLAAHLSLAEKVEALRGAIWFRTRLGHLFNDREQGHQEAIKFDQKRLDEMELQLVSEKMEQKECMGLEDEARDRMEDKKCLERKRRDGKTNVAHPQPAASPSGDDDEIIKRYRQEVKKELDAYDARKRRAVEAGLELNERGLLPNQMLVKAFKHGDTWFFGFFICKKDTTIDFFASCVLNFDLVAPCENWKYVYIPPSFDSTEAFDGVNIPTLESFPFGVSRPIALFKVDDPQSRDENVVKLSHNSTTLIRVTRQELYMIETPAKEWMYNMFSDIGNLKNYIAESRKRTQHPQLIWLCRKFVIDTYKHEEGLIFEPDIAARNLVRFAKTYYNIE